MNKSSAKFRAEKLRDEINELRYRYHVLDDPKVTDEVYDSLTQELRKIEAQYPDLVTPDSPTQRVGGKPLEKFTKVHHQSRMLSLNDVFSESELDEWESRLKRLEPEHKWQYFCETKFDGLAISLVYRDGILFRAATRGDGLVGEDVTQNIKTIRSIPLKLRNKKFWQGRGDIEVRGEALMDKKAFGQLNRKQKAAGASEFANPRNAAAGSIRQLDPKITVERKLDFYAYDLVDDLGQKTHAETHELCRKFGFKTAEKTSTSKNLKEVASFVSKVSSLREKLPFEIDGVVVLVNENSIRQRFGVAGKAPRGMVAYKFPGKKSTTIVEQVIVQVGRTGKLTPVAVLKPVEVGGVTVSRATLHNFDEIKRLGLKIGDTVVVSRAGDVIPRVEEVLTKLRNGKEKRFQIPHKCPVCGGKIKNQSGEVDFYCANPKCFVKTRRGIRHFTSKAAFDIEGLGPKIIDKFAEEGLITDAADLFGLELGDITALERFAEKSAENIYQAIQAARHISLSRFIYALGIKHVGEQTAFDLAKFFGSLHRLREASVETLSGVENIGEVVAQSVHKYFRDRQNQRFLERLLKVVKIEDAKKENKSKKLRGLKIIVTGSLESMSREQAKRAVMENGGDFVSSVSKQTDYLVEGTKPGSKLGKAKKFGVKIITEQEFLKLIK